MVHYKAVSSWLSRGKNARLVAVVVAVLCLYHWRAYRTFQRAIVVTAYINSVKLSNGTLVVPMSRQKTSDSLVAEQRALTWLVYNDPLPLWPDNHHAKFRLRQRYALLTLLLQYPKLVAKGFNGKECEWPTVEKCVKLNASSPTTKPRGADVVTEMYFFISWRYDITPLPGSTLSPDLGLLSHLEEFIMIQTALHGSLSSTFGLSWTNLKSFAVMYNRLTGSIPSSLGTTWTNLESFAVINNRLTGSIPSSLGTTWTNLERFKVPDNALTGTIPPLLGMTWNNITSFEVQGNALLGTIPDLARNWSKLSFSSFLATNLTGSVPSGFCQWKHNSHNSMYMNADCELVCPCCTFCRSRNWN